VGGKFLLGKMFLFLVNVLQENTTRLDIAVRSIWVRGYQNKYLKEGLSRLFAPSPNNHSELNEGVKDDGIKTRTEIV